MIGLVPLSAMLESGQWFHQDPSNATDEELVDSAIEGLGLDYLKEFDSESSIIEWAIRKEVN